MKPLFLMFAMLLAFSTSFLSQADDSADATLAAFHEAGAQADSTAMLNLVTADVVFLDIYAPGRRQGSEVHQHIRDSFSRGASWVLQDGERNISVSDNGAVAWFDESVVHENLGRCRGSGVLVRGANGWLIAQYSLSLPVPDTAVSVTAPGLPGAGINTETDASTPITTNPAETAAPKSEEKTHCRRKRHKTNTRAKC